jgi:hypothetical protein
VFWIISLIVNLCVFPSLGLSEELLHSLEVIPEDRVVFGELHQVVGVMAGDDANFASVVFFDLEIKKMSSFSTNKENLHIRIENNWTLLINEV